MFIKVFGLAVLVLTISSASCKTNTEVKSPAVNGIATASSNKNDTEKCGAWFKKTGLMERCCRLAIPYDPVELQLIIKEGLKSNLTGCQNAKKVSEKLGLTAYDKSVFTTYLKRVVNDTEWVSIYQNNLDICMTVVPKFSELFDKKMNPPNVKCDSKIPLTVDCLMTAGMIDCPAKYFNDTAECKDLRTNYKDCLQNPDLVIKYWENLPPMHT